MKTIALFVVCMFGITLAQRPTASDDDFRNEFDRLLVATAIERFRAIEHGISRLQRDINQLEETKSKEEQSRIVSSIEVAIDIIAGAKGTLERELQRTDLDLLERFNFESALAVGKALTDDLKAVEAKVKAIETH